MPKVTTAYAKNIIRRSLRELIDPTPDREALKALWEHFASSCAYCGTALTQGSKLAHADHLVSASRGGSNRLSNRVLSCAQCNEVEKRDSDWQAFLRQKCGDDVLFQERHGRICAWTARSTEPPTDSQLLKTADDLAAEVVTFYEQRVAAMRRAQAANE